MFKPSKRTLAILLTAVALSLVWAGLTLAEKGGKGKGGGGGEPVPSGPGLIALNHHGVIALMNPDGTGWTPVADVSSGRKLAWSPIFSDGTVKLAYPQTDPDTFDSYLLVVDVFPEIGEPVSALTVEDTPSSGGLYQVDCSPLEVAQDGTERVRVSYATWKDWDVPDLRREVIHIVDLIYDPVTGDPETGFFTLTGDPPLELDPGPGADYWMARFSPPDGTLLAVTRLDGSTHRSIWLASTDGSSEPVPLIDEPGVLNSYPAWSPDGSQLAFVSDRDGQSDIYLFHLDGTATERLTTTKKVAERRLTWSPDGLQIGFQASASRSGRWLGIMKLLLDTGEQFELGSGQWPDWSPMDLPPLP